VKFFTTFIILFFLYSCGQQVAPTGGPRDSIPPKLVSSIPAFDAKNFKGDRVTLLFDEYVSLDNPYEKLIYSPTPKNNPFAESKLKTVTIKIKDTLEENTTYSIDFGNAIRDINENNELKNFFFTFSTGDTIDSAFLTGKVIIAETGKTDSTLIAVLHRNPDDSAVAKEKPRYYTKLKGDGSFLFRNLKPGDYHLFAIKDADGGKKYDQPSEMIAFLDRTISVGQDTSTTLYAFEEAREIKPVAKTSTAKTTAAKKSEDVRLRLVNNLDAGRQDLLNNLILTSEHPLKTLDTSKIRLTDKAFNRLSYQIEKDSTNKQITIIHKWTENTSYNLVMEKEFAADTMGNKFIKTDTIPFNSKKESDYGSMDIRFDNIDTTAHAILLLIKDNKTILNHPIKGNRHTIKLFNPGEYQISVLFDRNNNGKWDTGNYWKKLQPEIVVARKQTLMVRSNWDNELRLDMAEFNK
jgi:uncharacterized protein (DUF2141 family)